MKAERINQNQIRFTLGAEDLKKRNIKLSELSYGSEKTKELFQDMMITAQQQFGFDFSAQPIMIEAVPLGSGSIMITVTKVHKPQKGEGLIQSITTPLSAKPRIAGSEPAPAGASVPEPKPASGKPESPAKPFYYLFEFADLETLQELVSRVPADLQMPNRLYLDPKTNYYYIETQPKQRKNPAVPFTLRLMHEYSRKCLINPMLSAYMQEHAKCLIRSRALQKLKELA